MMADKDPDQGASSNYRAFISYSHADADIVRKLHSQLETYRLPKGLGEITSQNAGPQRSGPQRSGPQRSGPKNPGPRDLGKIFRDREYLSVAQDLSASVKSALERSEVLVVVCSPQAKDSHWVEREIQYFRSLHKDRPILAALVEGEPEDAFPNALIEGGVEPLAADLRKHGDGWKLGFLKLVAGIVEVPLDALIQRDSQRQLTRVMAVTGVVGIFALCMMAMAFVAIQARNEAQFQQAQAEELVSFYVGEHREDLRALGRLDVMARVNERLLEYFKTQVNVRELSPDSLSLRARVLHAMGEDELTREGGDWRKAGEMLREAYRGTVAALEASPDNPDRIYDHAQSAFWIGRLAYDADNLDGARGPWKDYQELTARLHEIDSTNTTYMVEAASGEGNMCLLESDIGKDLDAAFEHCDASLALFIKARNAEPDEASHLSLIANQYAWLGDIHAQRGLFDEERRVRIEGEKHAELLMQKEPENRDGKDLWLASQIAIAQDEFAAGERLNAYGRMKRAHPIAKKQILNDPDNGTWKKRFETIERMRGSYARR